MSRLCKLIWLCLLALALPMQGVAAVTMAHCGPSHERMHGAAQVAQLQHDTQAAHGHHGLHDGQAMAHAPADAAHGAHAHDGHAPAPAADSDPLSDLAQYQCSACGTCCAAAALLPAAPHLPATAPAALPAAERGAAQVAYLTDGPERPPRTVRA